MFEAQKVKPINGRLPINVWEATPEDQLRLSGTAPGSTIGSEHGPESDKTSASVLRTVVDVLYTKTP